MPRPGEHLLLSGETREVIGAAMEVHRRLGPGYLESVYESALAHELGLRGIQFVEQGRLEVRYKGMVVGDFKYDFLVEKSVIVELKAVPDRLSEPGHEGRRDPAGNRRNLLAHTRDGRSGRASGRWRSDLPLRIRA